MHCVLKRCICYNYSVMLLRVRAVAAGRGQTGHAPRAALYRGRHLEGQKYGIIKFWPYSSELAFALQTVIFYTL